MYRYFNKIGWDYVDIEELEYRENMRLEDLLLLENSYLLDVVRIDPNCLNCNIAYIPEDKRIEWERNMNKKWYQDNIEHAKKIRKEWNNKDRQNNPEKYKQISKEQYQKNREEILKKKKEERQGEDGDKIRERERQRLQGENGDKIRETRRIYEKSIREKTRTLCECGSYYDNKSKRRHMRCKKHIRFVEEKEKHIIKL